MFKLYIKLVVLLSLSSSVALATIQWKEKVGLERPTVVECFWIAEFTNSVLPFTHFLLYGIESEWLASSNTIESCIADLKSGAIPTDAQLKVNMDTCIGNDKIKTFQVIANDVGKQFKETHTTVIPVEPGTTSTTTAGI